jgi:hypothetical protein
MIDACKSVDGMIIGRGNQSARRNIL